MNEKSIMPLSSYSAYTPPFQYSAFIDLQLNFSRLCQNRLALKKSSVTQKEENSIHRLSVDIPSPDLWKYPKKPLPQRQYVFGEAFEESSANKTTFVSKLKHKKGLSLIESVGKPNGEVPDLLIYKSPTNIINRFVSPFSREIRDTPKSVSGIRKDSKEKKRNSNLPVLVEDEKRLKEFLFDYFMKALQISNGICSCINELKNYKFFVGPGNNSELVAKIIRNRPWWRRVESTREANFVWTSLKHKKTLRRLPSGNDLVNAPIEVEHKKVPIRKAAEIEKYGYGLVSYSKFYRTKTTNQPLYLSTIKVHNRLEQNKQLCSKKKLFQNLKVYYEQQNMQPFDFIPVTFHIRKGVNDSSFEQFKEEFNKIQSSKSEKVWIIKPGENTNRGKGIKVSNSLDEITEIISNPKEGRTYIIQKYIEKPLLISKRKFDIRCFALLTSINNNIQGYFYPEGYIRTSSKEFSVKSFNKFIHLTNDAIQKKSEEYGKFEAGNKISYNDFQAYVDQEYPSAHINFERDINSQIRSIIFDTCKASHMIIDPSRRLHTFELLGYDFMVDQNFKVWLIEVNTNPCLELSCSYLSRLIPAVLDNCLRITIDQIFAPDPGHKKFQRWIAEGGISNKFELIFSEVHSDETASV